MNAGLACLVFLVVSPLQQAPPRAATLVAFQAPSDADANRLDRRLLDAHNRARAEAKLPSLTLDAKLNEAARRHAEDMAAHEKMSHEGSDSSTPDQRVKRVGYHYIRTGENVAAGQEGVDEVLEAWMESPGHKANILGPFTQMGAAQAVHKSGEFYWCVEFGTPFIRLNPDEAAAATVEKLNAARKVAGADALEVDEKLSSAARKLAVAAAEAASLCPDKAQNSEEPDQLDVVKLLQESGVSFSKLNKCMASGNPTADDVVESLLSNEKQRETLLGPFKTVGIGYANGSDDTPFWCVLLVEP